MSETRILEQIAMMNKLHDEGVRAEPTRGTRRELAARWGIRVRENQVPMAERESWTLPEAARVWGVDRHALQRDANLGILPTFRPRTVRGTRSWRRVTRKAMEAYVASFEE